MDFFTRYNEAERPAQGHNGSVRKASSAEAKKAIYTNKSFASPDLLVVTVPRKDCKSNCSNYVIKPPVAQPYTPPGHATRTSIAYDIQRDVIVFFKDSWRVVCDKVMREGEVYAILSAVKVPNIPHCSASGDIGDDLYHLTSTSRFAKASWAVKSTQELTPHQHHRLILDDIGKRLETFRCSKDMVSAIQAALTGVYPALFTSLAG